MPPLIIARTVCRFGSKRRALTLFAWLCCRPTTGAFPQNSHCFAISQLRETDQLYWSDVRAAINGAGSLSGQPAARPSTAYCIIAIEQIEESAPVVLLVFAPRARRLLDLAQHDTGAPLEGGTALRGHLSEHGLQQRDKPFGRERRWTMLVDEAARCGFEGRCHRGGRVRHVVVDERLEFTWFVADQNPADEQKQLRLRARSDRAPLQGTTAHRAAAGGLRRRAGECAPKRDRHSPAGIESRRAAWCRSTPHRFVCSAPGMCVELSARHTRDRARAHYGIFPAKIASNSSERGLQSLPAE